MMLNVALTIDQEPPIQSVIPKKSAGMQPFKKDRIIIVKKVFKKSFRHPSCNDIRFGGKVGSQTGPAAIVMYRFTIHFQFRRSLPTVFITVQVNSHTGSMKSFDLVKNVDNPTVISGKRDVEGDDMKA